MDGCTRSAVSIIRMSTRLDRGELLAQQPFDIGPDDYRLNVEASIVRTGVPLALQVIDQLAHGTTTPLEQVGDGSYARKLKPEDELIDWSQPVDTVFNLIRALAPEPAASTFQGTERVRITRARPLPAATLASADVVPGHLALFERRRAAVRCGDGWLELLQLQFPGKVPQSTADLFNGRRLSAGSSFSSHPTT
jgi:methionyl-tRNA formyltransferase